MFLARAISSPATHAQRSLVSKARSLVNNGPRVAPTATLSLPFTSMQKMGVSMQFKKKGLITKGAIKKRFRITGRGHLKCFPSSMPNKTRFIRFRGVWGPPRVLKQVFHTSKWKRVFTMKEKSKWRENTDILKTLDNIAAEHEAMGLAKK